MDIRELYNSLAPEDRAVYQSIRTNMRKVYLNAHTNIVGMDNWHGDDDAFLDLLDIKIATLFDRASLIEGTKPIIDKEQQNTIEKSIEDKGTTIGIKMVTEMSEASQKLAASKANGEAKW